MKGHRTKKLDGYEQHGLLLVPGRLAEQIIDEGEAATGDTDRTAWEASSLRSSTHVPDQGAAQSAATSLSKCVRRQHPVAQIFQSNDVAQMQAQTQNRSKSNDKGHELTVMLAGLTRTPIGERMLVRVPKRLSQICTKLREEMPNLGHALDLIERHLLLQRGGDGVLCLPPLLLAGPPGVGKTYFASRLAAALGTPCEIIGMETTTAVWILAGSSLGWNSGGPGRVFELLVHGHVANPFLVLDEIDKSPANRAYPPINALYPLLEPGTARKFRDEACRDVPLDARHINWIATANELDKIPAPILSRLTVVDIPPPTYRQHLLIARCVYRDLRREHAWGRHFEPEIDPQVVHIMATGEGAIREIRALMLGCFALAYAQRRRRLLQSDVVEILRKNTAIDLETVPVAGHA
jgi:ATP-dependent Lon protease